MRSFAFAAALVAAPLFAQSSTDAAFEAARTIPLAAGQWSYSATATGSIAKFADRFVIRCDRVSRTISLGEVGVLPMPGRSTPLTIATDTQSRVLPTGGATLRASDSLLDAMAFSRGRFVVAGSGGTLVIPAWPEAARSIEDCRN